jgi:hypothetical protein
VYEKYRDDGFTILSLSFDDRPDDVTQFRSEGEHTMPWLHAFVTGGFRSTLATTFGVVGIPKPILVGADGSIVATSGLRGEELDKTLATGVGARDALRCSARGRCRGRSMRFRPTSLIVVLGGAA